MDYEDRLDHRLCYILRSARRSAIVSGSLKFRRARRLEQTWPRANPPEAHRVLRVLLGTFAREWPQSPDFPPPPTILACLTQDPQSPMYYAVTRSTLADRPRENQFPS